MSALQIFEFETCVVRSLLRGGEPWFVGKDVCGALGLQNHNQALSRLDEDEKSVFHADGAAVQTRSGGRQEMAIVSEPGVYRLVFTSRTEAAERFKRWLAHDVLPVLRRTGSFVMDDDPPMDNLPTLEHGRLWGQPVGKINAAARMISVAHRIYGPEAARALWERENGLPDLTGFAIGEVVDKPADDPRGCLAHLLRAAVGDGRSLGQMLDLALRDKIAAKAMRELGFHFDPQGARGWVAIANAHAFLAAVYAETQWADAWRLALAKLPNARPSPGGVTFGKITSRAVLIPGEELVKFRNPTH